MRSKDTIRACHVSYCGWRILFLTTIGRTTPNLNSECLFDPIEWQNSIVMIQ